MDFAAVGPYSLMRHHVRQWPQQIVRECRSAFGIRLESSQRERDRLERTQAIRALWLTAAGKAGSALL